MGPEVTEAMSPMARVWLVANERMSICLSMQRLFVAAKAARQTLTAAAEVGKVESIEGCNCSIEEFVRSRLGSTNKKGLGGLPRKSW